MHTSYNLQQNKTQLPQNKKSKSFPRNVWNFNFKIVAQ